MMSSRRRSHHAKRERVRSAKEQKKNVEDDEDDETVVSDAFTITNKASSPVLLWYSYTYGTSSLCGREILWVYL